MKLKNMLLAFMLGCLSVCAASQTPTIYVGNTGYLPTYNNTVSAISAATNAVIATITVGKRPSAIVTTPDGLYAYVGNAIDGTVSVITTATNTVKTTLSVGAPDGFGMTLAITPNGSTIYVGNWADGYVYPITVATNAVGSPITVNNGTVLNNTLQPSSIAFTSDGKYAYVASGSTSDTSLGADVARITIANNSATIIASPIDNTTNLTAYPTIAVTSDNAVYVVVGNAYIYYLASGSNTFTPISYSGSNQVSFLVSNGATAYALDISVPGTYNIVHALSGGAIIGASSTFPNVAGNEGSAFGITPNGKTLYAPTFGIPYTAYPITTTAVGSGISIGNDPGNSMAFTTDSKTVYIVSAPITSGNGYITPITVATGVAGTAIPVGLNPACIAISTQTTLPVPPTTALTNAARAYAPAKPQKGI